LTETKIACSPASSGGRRPAAGARRGNVAPTRCTKRRGAYWTVWPARSLPCSAEYRARLVTSKLLVDAHGPVVQQAREQWRSTWRGALRAVALLLRVQSHFWGGADGRTRRRGSRRGFAGGQ
jgi:hypothetical protein